MINVKLALNKEQAVRRMTQRSLKTIKWTLKGVTVEWRYIPATSCRNWDGSVAGEGQPPNKEILQRMVWWDGEHPRYTNWWY